MHVKLADEAVRIEDVGVRELCGTLVAAAPENFGEPIEQRIDAFLTFLTDVCLHLGEFGDFLGQRVIEQFPYSRSMTMMLIMSMRHGRASCGGFLHHKYKRDQH